MTVVVETWNIEGDSAWVTLDRFPDRCPMCHHHIEAKSIDNAFRRNSRVEIAFRCPRRDCQRMFIGTFRLPMDRSEFELKTTGPSVPLEPIQPDMIKEVSPSFVKIYKQAAHAESIDLMEVAGIGYRKALEFLIKDFAIRRQPDKDKEIKEAYLGTVINNHIDDPQVKTRAKRATWLGNDESHYVREWVDKDISDLKILIQLTRNAIENVLLADSYVEDMPEKTKNPK
jgi:hypothetical protein